MIGNQSLLELRMSGVKPSDVWVVCLPERPEYGPYSHPEKQVEVRGMGHLRGYPTIHVFDDEPASSLDLRTVIGTTVHIAATDRERGLDLLDRIATFSPLKAIAAGPWGMIGWKPERGIVEFRI